jgi:hypothetical protein
MKCSTLLPTTVDFGNNLVNYIEVSADDLPRDETPAEIPNDPIGGGANNAETPQAEPTPSEEKAEPKPASRMKPVTPEGQYTSQIPQYLIDMDKPEDSAAYQYAIAAIDKLPSPPSLPGFLGKPILNAATPMKDDNSVLTMPNHTVLNHLATSSIKNNVLAVSATTRYKRKVWISRDLLFFNLLIIPLVCHDNYVQAYRGGPRIKVSSVGCAIYGYGNWLIWISTKKSAHHVIILQVELLRIIAELFEHLQ